MSRRTKARNRWTANEDADRVCGPVGVEDCGKLAYRFNRRGGLAGPTAQSSD